MFVLPIARRSPRKTSPATFWQTMEIRSGGDENLEPRGTQGCTEEPWNLIRISLGKARNPREYVEARIKGQDALDAMLFHDGKVNSVTR